MSRTNDSIRSRCAAIVREHGPQSRKELSARLGLSAVAIAKALALSKELVSRFDPKTGVLRHEMKEANTNEEKR